MNGRMLIRIVCAAVVCAALLSQMTSASATLSAGAAKVSITPSLKQFPTLSLAGFGERLGKPAQGVRDDIFSRALVLSDGDTKVALVSTDLAGISPGMKDAVVAKVSALGFTADTVMLAATHSHSAPECLHPGGDAWPLGFGKFHPKFFDWTTERIAESIRIADSQALPAYVGFAAAPLDGLNRNRRASGGGVVDPTMTVMKIVTAGGGPGARMLAMMVNFTAHPTMMGADSFLISGEWPGAMSRELERRLGGNAVAMFFNGAEGDQTTAGDFGSGWERVDAYGKAIAGQAWGLVERAVTSPDVDLQISTLMWTLPKRRLSPAFMASTGQEYQAGAVSPKALDAIMARLFPAKVELQAVRVGNAALMAVPGEAITELGLQMKRDAASRGAEYPMIVGLANNAVGYILSFEQYDLGAYESGTSFHGPMLGAILVSQMEQMVRPLFRPHPE